MISFLVLALGLVSATVATYPRATGSLSHVDGCSAFLNVDAGLTIGKVLAHPTCKFSKADLLAANPLFRTDHAFKVHTGVSICVAGPKKLWPGARLPHEKCTKYHRVKSGETCSTIAVLINDLNYSASSFVTLNTQHGRHVNCKHLTVGEWYCSCNGADLAHKPPVCHPICKHGRCTCSSTSSHSCRGHLCTSSGGLIGIGLDGFFNHDGHRCDLGGSLLVKLAGGIFKNRHGQRCNAFGQVGVGAGIEIGGHSGLDFGAGLSLGGIGLGLGVGLDISL